MPKVRAGRKRYKKLKPSDPRVLSIRLSKKQYDKLDTISAAQSRSMNGMVAHLIEVYSTPAAASSTLTDA